MSYGCLLYTSIAVGKVTRGSLKAGQNVTLAKRDGVTMQKTKIKDLMLSLIHI